MENDTEAKQAQVDYFENVDAMLETYTFETDESKSAFVDSVLSEILNAVRENKTVLTHNVMSRVVERVVHLMSEEQIQKFYLVLQGKLLYLADRPAASYVLETLIKRAPHNVVQAIAEEVIVNDVKARLVWSKTGSHVVRALVTCLQQYDDKATLGDCASVIFAQLKKSRHAMLMRTFPVAVTLVLFDALPSCVAGFCETVLDDETTLESLLTHPIGSRIVQGIVQHAPECLADIFSSKKTLRRLSLDPVGMRVVASLIKYADAETAHAYFVTLESRFEKIIAAKNFVVLRAFLERVDVSIAEELWDSLEQLRQQKSKSQTDDDVDAEGTTNKKGNKKAQKKKDATQEGDKYFSVAHYLLGSPDFVTEDGRLRFGTTLLNGFFDAAWKDVAEDKEKGVKSENNDDDDDDSEVDAAAFQLAIQDAISAVPSD
eukprot:PhM_4_TR18645/c0_g1_i2/m.23225